MRAPGILRQQRGTIVGSTSKTRCSRERPWPHFAGTPVVAGFVDVPIGGALTPFVGVVFVDVVEVTVVVFVGAVFVAVLVAPGGPLFAVAVGVALTVPEGAALVVSGTGTFAAPVTVVFVIPAGTAGPRFTAPAVVPGAVAGESILIVVGLSVLAGLRFAGRFPPRFAANASLPEMTQIETTIDTTMNTRSMKHHHFCRNRPSRHGCCSTLRR